MIDILTIDYSVLDRPEVCMFLFHPRSEATEPDEKDRLIMVEDDIVVGGRFHMVKKTAPNILFFHGNGEVVSDYDDLGPMYNGLTINFIPVDYRGYGHSTGKPTVTAMMRDCHVIFDYVKNWLGENGFTGPLILMGRSLGSASVLELAGHYQNDFDGLVVESGFAYAEPLLRMLGINAAALGFSDDVGFQNTEKIRKCDKPTLIIHAEYDHIIPYSDGLALYDACGAADKTLLKVPGANHNDIFFRGLSNYLKAVKDLTEKLM